MAQRRYLPVSCRMALVTNGTMITNRCSGRIRPMKARERTSQMYMPQRDDRDPHCIVRTRHELTKTMRAASTLDEARELP